MRTFNTAIFISLLSLGCALNAQATETSKVSTDHNLLPVLEARASYGMLSAQTDHRFERKPERGSGRRDFVETPTSNRPL